jgi:hypothetical protein
MIGSPPYRRAAALHQDEAYWDPAFDYRAVSVWMPSTRRRWKWLPLQ